MNIEQVAAKVEAEIRRMADVDASDEDFGRDVHIFDYGYVDSFSAVELVTFCEKTFGIKVSDDDLAHRPLNTVNEISRYIVEKTGKRA